MTLSAPIDLQLVRQLFARQDRLAPSNFLRREIAGRMREKLELIKLIPESVLDAGCGEGADLAQLQTYYPKSHLLGVDASFAMLAAGLQQQHDVKSSIGRFLDKWLPSNARAGSTSGIACADFSCLPLASNSVDLLWSNLALHWHPQADLVFAEWRRVLRTEGVLMFSCFGPDTLLELRQAFSTIDQFPHTLPFVDMHDFGDMLVNCGLSTPVMDMEKLTLTYESVDKLFADVRALGGNPLLSRRHGLLGKHAYRRLRAELEKTRNRDGRIPLTFEVIYGHAFKPIPQKLASGETIVHMNFPKKQL
ncbi:MAG: methyltransferase domain-containing protein [Pseudomonadota bacterium]